MLETEEQKAAREKQQRLYMIGILMGNALPGVIGWYGPADLPEPTDPETRTVPSFSAEQIKEIACSAYEIAAASYEVMLLGESDEAQAQAAV